MARNTNQRTTMEFARDAYREAIADARRGIITGHSDFSPDCIHHLESQLRSVLKWLETHPS